MTLPHGSSLETRPRLLKRLQSSDDPQSWREFYQIYGGMIRFFATKAGLTPDEAEEVVQETAVGVARRLAEFVYDPKVCRFRTWLLNLTRWRIQNQLRKRVPPGGVAGGSPSAGGRQAMRISRRKTKPKCPKGPLIASCLLKPVMNHWTKNPSNALCDQS